MKLWNLFYYWQDDGSDSSSGCCNVHNGLLPVLRRAHSIHHTWCTYSTASCFKYTLLQWMCSNLLGILSENPPHPHTPTHTSKQMRLESGQVLTAQDLKVKNIKACVCPQRFEMTHSRPSFDASAHAHRHELLLSITSNTFSTFPNTDKTTQHSSSLKGISLL